MDDLISRQSAIDALGERPIVWDEWADEYSLGQRNQYDADKSAIETLPSAQPEYFDYTDIDEAWDYYAKEQDANLTDNAKQIKDAMWVGYRIGLKSAQHDRKTGKWIDVDPHGDSGLAFRCSECAEIHLRESRFCPSCGARMEGTAW